MGQKTLEQLCNEALIVRGINEEKYQRRLAEEMREVNAKDKHEYFLDLHARKVRYPKNPHNLLIPYLLGLVESVNIDTSPEYEYGESPDIDVDYLPIIRDYLKNKWAPEQFGQDKVCNIGSYNTFGIKSALIDMARVYDKNRGEILELTTQLSLKDDEGKPLTWDKAMELYPDLKKYCEANPDVADAAKRLLNRNRGMGKHAGGLIISSVPINQFVPLVRDKDGTPLSAWVEGLHGQDLGPMGLIKFDLLVITNLMQIAFAVKMIKERHNLDSFCALPGQNDWSDLKWLDDPKAIAIADRADLRCIFQFDSDGIRKMVKEGGVTSFEDLVAYTALYRPGPLGMKMHEHFIARKRGTEFYELHPLVKPILDVTYGVLVYQEQVLKILNVVGGIPMKDCETIRKAISKKKVELFAKYKEMFLANGQTNLGWTLEQVQNLWDQIAAFAEYGFNRSMTIGTPVLAMVCGKIAIKKIEDFVPGDVVFSVNEAGETIETEVVALHDHGELYGYEVYFDDGHSLVCSMDHKFLTVKGQISLREIIGTNSLILCDPRIGEIDEKEKSRWHWERADLDTSLEERCDAQRGGSPATGRDPYSFEHGMFCKFDWRNEAGLVEFISGHAPVNNTRRLVPRRIIRVVPVGRRQMYDLEVASPTHNYLLPNGVVTSNSHACAYTYISSMLLYIKAHFPLEFFAAILSCEEQAEKMKEYKIEAENHGIPICPLDINKSGIKFKIVSGGEENMDAIYIGFANVKGIGEAVAERITTGQPYKHFKDFLDRFGTDAGPIKALLGLSAFKDGPPVTLYKYAEWYRDIKKKREDRRKRFEAGCEKMLAGMQALLPFEFWETIREKVQYQVSFAETLRQRLVEWEGVHGKLHGEQSSEISQLISKYQKSCALYHKKVEADQTEGAYFDPSNIKIDTELEKLYASTEESEKAFYGFVWTHPLEKSPDYDHRTFERYRSENRTEGYVEVQILEATKTISKSAKKTVYYLLKVEDAHGEVNYIQVWENDWERFADWIVKDALLRLQLQAPSNGFKRYTLSGPKKHLRHTLSKSREYDFRVAIMRRS